MKVTDFIGIKVNYDKDGQIIWGVDKNGQYQRLLDIRGWGAIQNLFINKDETVDVKTASKFQDEVGIWITEAINDKLSNTSLKKVKLDLLEDFEILIKVNEDDFDRGGGKYILQQYIDKIKKQI